MSRIDKAERKIRTLANFLWLVTVLWITSFALDRYEVWKMYAALKEVCAINGVDL